MFVAVVSKIHKSPQNLKLISNPITDQLSECKQCDRNRAYELIEFGFLIELCNWVEFGFGLESSDLSVSGLLQCQSLRFDVFVPTSYNCLIAYMLVANSITSSHRMFYMVIEIKILY